jgi:phasin
MQPTGFEIPDQMREAADKSVEQARQAFEQFLDATQKALAAAEGQVKSAGEGAADLGRQTLAYAEQNVAASFDLARRLVQARTVEEMTALQQEYLRKQMAAAAEQGKALGDMVGRTAGAAFQKATDLGKGRK